MKKRIQEAWQSYEQKLLVGVSETQRTETRRAFYAGAGTTFHALVSNVKGGDEEPTAEELAVADDLNTEIVEWMDGLARGLN